MTASRWIPVVSVLCAVGALSSCSGDNGGGNGADGSDSPPTSASTVEARNGCTADVEITGALRQSWSGKAFSITENQRGPVQYSTTKGKLTLAVLGAEGDFDALANLTTPKGIYTSQGGTVEADDKGGGAKVDADATGVGAGKGIHVTASFDC
jgi:hypothetical protein